MPLCRLGNDGQLSLARFRRFTIPKSAGPAATRSPLSQPNFGGLRHRLLADVVRSLKGVLYAVCAGAVRYDVSLPLDDLVSSLPTLDWDDPGLSNVAEELRTRTSLSMLLMSDTVAVYSEPLVPDKPEFQERLASILLVGRILMMKLFEFHLSARGAIAFGEFHADARNSIFCGKALVESYEVAESQEWIGMSICDSLEAHVDSLMASFSIENYVSGM